MSPPGIDEGSGRVPGCDGNGLLVETRLNRSAFYRLGAAMTARELFSFPNPVNETSARVVAAGVVTMAVLFLITGWSWVLVALTYGFVARVLTGPTLSPLGRLATQVVTPRLRIDHQFCAGPPKRFAQGIGAAFTLTASVLWFGFGLGGPAQVVIAMLLVAASLEAFVGFCLGCTIFSFGMRVGIVPEEVCERCNNIWADRGVPDVDADRGAEVAPSVAGEQLAGAPTGG